MAKRTGRKMVQSLGDQHTLRERIDLAVALDLDLCARGVELGRELGEAWLDNARVDQVEA